MNKRLWLVAGLVLFGSGTSVGWAQVDCSDPNLLCTGDPCVIPRLQPEDPCVVDFGARDVVIEGLHDIGSVSFTAKSFAVEGSVGGGQNPGGNGPSLELLATEGVVLDAAIRLSTFNQERHLRVVAGGSIDANGPITLSSSLPFPEVGETLLLDSGADLAVRGRIRTRNAEGSLPVTLSAAGRVDLLATLRPEDDLLVDAGTDLVLDGSIVLRGGGGAAPNLSATAAGTLDVLDKIKLLGGAVSLEAGGDVTVERSIKNRLTQGVLAACQGLTIRSTGGNVSVNDRLECSGRQLVGPSVLEAAGDLTINGRIKTISNVNTGGSVSLTSVGGTLSLLASIDSRGRSGGDVTLTGSRVEVGQNVDSRSRAAPPGNQGGAQSYSATAGDLLLSGRFRAGEAGQIEGSATGNVTASGEFSAGTGGCIALAAGGVLDTSGATFDPGLAGSCP